MGITMGLFNKREKVKDGLHDPAEWELEPEGIVEINELHRNAARMRRAGDRPGEMIFEHHRQEKTREFERQNSRMVRFDEHDDRWYTKREE